MAVILCKTSVCLNIKSQLGLTHDIQIDTNRYSRQQRRLQEPFPVVQQHEGGGISRDEEADS